MFKTLHIRYQTARSLPAPYAYFYTLTAHPIGTNALQVELAITYPDREDIDDDELIAEGYTRDDDFTWSGKLPKAWLESFANLLSKTRLQLIDEESLGEDDDFWEMSIESDDKGSKTGTPANADLWQYLVQELMQAAYEATHRERPFELIYLDSNNSQGDIELHLTASFAERNVIVRQIQNQREKNRTLPWSTLQQVMSQVYKHDFSADDAQLKRPKRDGQWLNLGSEEWYDIRKIPALIRLLNKL
ncbi:hypothetical protein GCM10028805_50730 [Spirosoma harenae]